METPEVHATTEHRDTDICTESPFIRVHSIYVFLQGPLIVSTSTESMTKTKAAVALLKKLGAYADVEKVSHLRCHHP